ncbi:serine/threonine-protein kinase ATG1a isoform X2 [Prosopis cineraria]|uniref:serine/threonine-protein kinase ATG1a isoform X2 n=1 Tax=Prosopis cineraria TaxID=364024 RepID=UPI00240F82DE|nr:serine/threonine-protein kinase ATG1a isoform X2 [Prosopis cineraria]
MDFGAPNQPRLVGEYMLGPQIGSGSFAVVWRSRHRHSGLEVAVKEIEKKQLSPKVSENLLKEISILSTINHPNIIRLFEAIQTNDRIYLILEYCNGGDLATYIHRRGKVSQPIARHFMRHLGLMVLQENHLIHRDLKPQNLLLSSTGGLPLLKIGDFGFARSLTPQGLADTLCGSPLYMAPEIIQNQKYDAKADLWSVGAILFQLVTGRPPFDGNNQLQLFQNILTSTELQFPQESLNELHPDCLDLCRSLLRLNPVERLTFKEFFGHNFLKEPRSIVNVERSSVQPPERSMFQQCGSISTSDKRPHLHSALHLKKSVDDPVVISSAVNETVLLQRKHSGNTADTKSVKGIISRITCDKQGLGNVAQLSDQPQASHLMESIEEDYVLVPHFASLEVSSDYFEASTQDNITSRVSICPSKRVDLEVGVAKQTKDLAFCNVDREKRSKSGKLETSSVFAVPRKEQGASSKQPSSRLDLLHQYVQALSALSQEKYDAGLYLESFAIELVVLAIWKKALEICNSWLASIAEGKLPGSTSGKESTISDRDESISQPMLEKIDFSDPSAVSLWAKKGFIFAVDHADKLSSLIQNMDGAAEMPYAMEIIFQKVLSIGTSGAVDECLENRGKAAASYSKAMLLLSFVVNQAVHLPLNPPFSLTPANKERILQYISKLQSRQLQSSPSF